MRRHEIASELRLLDYARGLRERETREESQNLAMVRGVVDGESGGGDERGEDGDVREERRNRAWAWGEAVERDELEEIRRAVRDRERRISGLDPGAWDGNA